MSTRGIDYGKLTLRDALDLAIHIEEEARDRYEELAEQMEQHRTPEAAAFFRTMAGNEARHGSEIALRRRQHFGDAPATVTRAMLFDVEAPEYDQGRAFMSARAALEVALVSETKAHAFFAAALPAILDLEVRRLFEELRDEELVHQDLVRREIARLPPDAGGDPEAFVDEPVAQ